MRKNIFWEFLKKLLIFIFICGIIPKSARRDGWVGLRRTTGNRVWANTPTRVRISFSPPRKKEHLLFQVILYHTFANKSRRSLVYHPQLVAVYHQHEVLYIIKSQVRCTLTRDDIQPQRGWWYAPHFVRRWYAKPVAWINKKELSVDKSSFFVGTPNGNRTHN